MECFSAFLFVLLAVSFGWLYRVSRRLRGIETRLTEVSLRLTELRVAGRAAARTVPPPVETTPPLPEEAPPAPEETVPVEPAIEAPLPPPPEPPAPTPEPPAPAPAPPRIDWERWIGVRGAAVVGAAVLGLAGLLFLKYSIEQGLVPPPVRVAAAVLAGLGCLVGSESLRRREHRYEATADALAGAGVVLLYGAVWAARTLYALIGAPFAFALMVLVTLACGALSWRHASRVIAVLGLAGGFAAPAFLTAAQDRPITLFGYLLLLNLGVLVLALRRGWTLLAALSLAVTTIYQASWIVGRMGPESALLGLAVLAVFAGLYAAAGRRAALVQAAGVLVPFAFTFYFAGNADLGAHLYPLAALLLLLSLLARRIARRQGRPLFGVAAAAASVAAVMVWWVRVVVRSFDEVPVWEGVVAGVVLSLAFHLFWELEKRKGTADGPVTSAERVAALGFLLLFVVVPLGLREPSPWPWICGWTVLAVLLFRQGKELAMVASVLVGTGAGAFFLVHGGVTVLVYALAAALACQAAALVLRGRSFEIAAAALPLTLLVLLATEATRHTLAPWAFYAVTLAAAALVALAATRLPSGGLYFAAMAVLAVDHWLWTASSGHLADADAVLLGFALQAAAAVAFTAWPFLAGGAFRPRPWAWYAAALAGPAWFLSLRPLFVRAFGDAFIGILPVALAGLSLAALSQSRRLRTGDDSMDRSRLAWFAAVTLAFVSVAIPLQLDKEWITLGWALEGLAVIVLWKRLDHAGLKYFGLALLAAAGVRLVANPAVPGYYPAGGWPVVNWLLYTYLVPAAALVLAARVLAPLEASRRRAWERPLYARGWPVAAGACGLAAIAVVFVWINLAIFDYFSLGRQLIVSFDRLPARDLTMSLAWTVYALVLLAVGMAGRIKPLRWVSLAFLVLTLGKAFLYDLGELTDLYRVASLVGLAVSLLVVSLAYQRFVFGRASSTRDGRRLHR